MNPEKPFITIITPTFNASQTIERCLASVASQTFSNYQHLIMDGASVDSTAEIVEQFQKKSSQIKLSIGKDKGVFDAMNKGIQMATSDWLFFIGADDFFYDNNVLEDVCSNLQIANADIVYGNVFFESMKRVYDGPFDVEKILKVNICHQSMFYRASVFTTIGLYSLKYKKVADYDFNLQCWLNGKVKHLFIPRTIAYYSHGGVSSIGDDQDFFEDYPRLTVNAVIYGNSDTLTKIGFLSKVFRKILQRYTFRIFLSQLNNSKFFLTRYVAAFWMVVTIPFYAIRKFFD